MLAVDFHTHSFYSNCGVHSVVEMLTRARELGMAGIAITDHGPCLGGRLNSVFFERLIDPLPGIRLLKGIELNIDEGPGIVDMPRHLMQYCDVLLLGIHPNTPSGWSAMQYTDALIHACRNNPFVDILTHLNSSECPVDAPTITKAAAELDVVIEINNSKTALKRVADEVTMELIECCRDNGCRIVVNSDAHTLNEVGCDEAVRPLLEQANFPIERIVNATAETAFAFVDERKSRKVELPLEE
jgi:putative hydrolase